MLRADITLPAFLFFCKLSLDCSHDVIAPTTRRGSNLTVMIKRWAISSHWEQNHGADVRGRRAGAPALHWTLNINFTNSSCEKVVTVCKNICNNRVERVANLINSFFNKPIQQIFFKQWNEVKTPDVVENLNNLELYGSNTSWKSCSRLRFPSVKHLVF